MSGVLDPPSGPVPAAAVAPAGSLDSFCPLIDLAAIISDNGRHEATRHAEKPYTARKVHDLPGCYVRSSGLTAIRTPLRTDPRADLKRLLRQHHHLACREPNKDFEETHLRRRILLRTF